MDHLTDGSWNLIILKIIMITNLGCIIRLAYQLRFMIM